MFQAAGRPALPELPQLEAFAANKAGLDTVLESLAQKKKVAVIDTSRSHWEDFKKVGNQLEEELLEAHKSSGGTYSEKKELLSTANCAEYKRDRDARLAS